MIHFNFFLYLNWVTSAVDGEDHARHAVNEEPSPQTVQVERSTRDEEERATKWLCGGGHRPAKQETERERD